MTEAQHLRFSDLQFLREQRLRAILDSLCRLEDATHVPFRILIGNEAYALDQLARMTAECDFLQSEIKQLCELARLFVEQEPS